MFHWVAWQKAEQKQTSSADDGDAQSGLAFSKSTLQENIKVEKFKSGAVVRQRVFKLLIFLITSMKIA